MVGRLVILVGVVALAGACGPGAEPDVSGTLPPTPTQAVSSCEHSSGPAPEPLSITQVRLDEAADALIAGERDCWLALADPNEPGFRARLDKEFDYLTSMRLSGWRAYVDPPELQVQQASADTVDLTTIVAFCAQSPTCPTDPITVAKPISNRENYYATFTWHRVDGRWYLADIRPKAGHDPHPFATGSLSYASGELVTLFGPTDGSVDLDGLLARAEAAAAHIHRIVPRDRPSRFVVYIGSDADFRTWFNLDLGEYAGLATTTSPITSRVMIRAGELSMDYLFRHELTHAATHFNLESIRSNALNEGIAEYIAYYGQPAGSVHGLAQLRNHIDTWGWNEDLEFPAVMGAWADYAVGYLTLHCLTDNWGEAAMWEFFYTGARTGSMEDAAAAAAGLPWAEVEARCVDYIYTITGVA